MFEDSQRVDPDTLYADLAAAIAAIPVHPEPGGSATESGARLRALMTLARRLDARVHGALASFDGQGFAAVQGSASTAAWWAAHAKLNRGQAGRMVHTARLLRVLPKLTEVLAAGTIGVEHLDAVSAGARRLPYDVLALADQTLRDFSGSARPADMRRVTERLQALHDATQVEENVQHVHDSRSLSLSLTFGGAWRLDALLEPEAGAMLAAALQSLNSKRGPEDDRPAVARNADALTELVDLALRSGKLPDCGGDRPRVTFMVTVPRAGSGSPVPADRSAADALAADLDRGDEWGSGDDLDSGVDLTAGVVLFDQNARLLGSETILLPTTIHRICCDADLNLALLSPVTGEPLTHGRDLRDATRAQRRALVLRDGGCVFPGCDRAPAACQAHHQKPWKPGGLTDLCNLCLICSFHHHLVHEGGWILQPLPAGPEHPAGGWRATALDGYQVSQYRQQVA